MSYLPLHIAAIVSTVAVARAEPRLSTVTGRAELLVPPEAAVVSVGVRSLADTLEAARRDNDDRVKRVLLAVRAAGVKDEDVTPST